MNAYITPIKIALFAFPIIAILITAPVLLFEYHKYGSFNKAKGFIFYTFIFYMLCAYFLVILPLPEVSSVTTQYKDMIQPIPFRFIADFFKETVFVISDPSTYAPALLQGVVLQPIFNLLMIVPFGIYMRYYFRKDFKQTLYLSFLLSLFFELTQLSGLYGIYSGPYRLFDVDDLIINTLGGVVGYSIAPYLTSFFPSRDAFDMDARARSENVSLVRRFLSFLVDHTIVVWVSNTTVQILSTNNTITYLTIYLLYYVLFAYLRKGRTLAQSFLHLKTAARDGERVKIQNLFDRSMIIYLTIEQPAFIGSILQSLLPTLASGDGFNSLFYILIVFSIFGFLFLHYVNVIITRKNVFFYEIMSHTHIENTARNK